MLPLRKDPIPLIRKEIKRHWSQVDPALKSVMAKLVTGEMPWPLFLIGGVGVGKTYAALCLCDSTGHRCLYFTVPGLHEDINEARQGRLWTGDGEHRVTLGRLWSEWRGAQLTVLDEFGTRGSISEPMYETCKRAIDSREGKPAIYISNLGLEELGQVYDDRVASRLAAGTVFKLESRDRRLKK